jgi:Fibronectin type III domain
VIGLANFLKWVFRGRSRRLSAVAALMVLPMLVTAASTSTIITWNPSTDPNVTGYNIYYGTQSGNYTNEISVGNVTNAAVGNLSSGTTYYFAAKSRDDAGDQSAFSNEASFTGYTITPVGSLNLLAMPSSLTNDQVTFSLGPGAPSGASINPTNGILSWVPGFANANTIQSFTVVITDLTNPNASTQTTFSVTVSDYLDFALTSVPLQTGQSASLPITVTSSDSVTNMVFTLNWPGAMLVNPSLTFNAPITGGTVQNQGTNLIIQLWTDNGAALIGTNLVAQLNFQAAAGQTSAFMCLPVLSAAGTKSSGAAFSYTVGEAGEAVIIGVNPLLRARVNNSQGRVLTLYANPGANYQLQQTTNISSPDGWQPVQTYQPTHLQQAINLDSANPVIFYRLQNE